MLKINYEFRKGIFFVRLFGTLKKSNYLKNQTYLEELITTNKFTYVVLNTNNITKIDLDGLNYLVRFCKIINDNSILVICDENKKINGLLNNCFPSIKSEVEIL